VTGKLSTR